ncbi:MAG TPA: hypothetical protein VFG04_26300 [Planctomycetaceae bacterium]|nr:hypothetical protein [Planctomycetaceae bacterium]
MIHRFGKGVFPFLFVFMTQALCAAAEPVPAALPPEPAKAAHSASELLFKEDFERPGSAIDPSKWRISKTKETDVIEVRHNAWPNTGGFAVITDSGDQGGSYRGWAGAIASQRSFSRGRNLRCTFKVAMPAHSGTGFSGPWHSTNVMTHQKYSMVNSMTGSIGFYCNGTYQPPYMEWDENNHDVDKNLPANGYLSGPRLAEDFLRAWRYSAPAFGSGSAWISIRVWLGDVSGAFCEWSTDDGKTWRPLRDRAHNAVIDTRGRTGVATDWGPACLSGDPVGVVHVNTTKDHYIAFGPVAGSVFIDDVIVERDALPFKERSSPPAPIRPATVTPARASATTPVLDSVLKRQNLRPVGRFVEVTVPDTLDLAARAELSLNALTRNSNPDDHHSVYETFTFGHNPPAMSKPGWFINPANLYAIPYLRTMCGSQAGIDVEYEMMKDMLGRIEPGGRLTFPNDAGWPAGTSVPNVNGQLAMALLNWYERDKNPGWLDYVALLCKGLDRSAIRVKDRAYYPLECGIDAGGEWRWTNRGGSVIPYIPPHEPESEQQGYEGSAKWMTVFGPIEALAGQYRYTSDAEALDLGMRLTRFGLKGPMWEGFSSLAYPGNQQGIFAGHFSGNVHFLNALLDMGMAQKNEALKQRARQGYELTRRVGVTRMGWYPSWIMNGTETYGRSKDLHGVCDSAGIAAALLLAVKLSDAGVGDYWDDVDYIVRNQLIEQQFTDANAMRGKAGGDPLNVIGRFVGGCGTGEPTAIKPEISGVATAATAAAFYHAWHGITRYDEDAKTGQVNLFLNRVSPWLDVESHLPFEGKVILRNKEARTVFVRLPMWLNDRLPMWKADQMAVACKRNGRSFVPTRVGRNLMLDVQEGDVVELSFPIPARTDKYTIHGKAYTIQFRGSTVVDIDNRNTSPDMIPIYQREAMKAGPTPMHTVKRFVADKIIPLSVQ